MRAFSMIAATLTIAAVATLPARAAEACQTEYGTEFAPRAKSAVSSVVISCSRDAAKACTTSYSTETDPAGQSISVVELSCPRPQVAGLVNRQPVTLR